MSQRLSAEECWKVASYVGDLMRALPQPLEGQALVDDIIMQPWWQLNRRFVQPIDVRVKVDREDVWVNSLGYGMVEAEIPSDEPADIVLCLAQVALHDQWSTQGWARAVYYITSWLVGDREAVDRAVLEHHATIGHW